MTLYVLCKIETSEQNSDVVDTVSVYDALYVPAHGILPILLCLFVSCRYITITKPPLNPRVCSECESIHLITVGNVGAFHQLIVCKDVLLCWYK